MTALRPKDVTMVENAIHNPADPRHFMRVVPAGSERVVTANGRTIARSDDAVIVKEVGFDLYDHVVYFPREAVAPDVLAEIDKSTHCPLKGNTAYFDLVIDGERIVEAAWSYVETIDEAAALRNLVAFDPSKVEIT